MSWLSLAIGLLACLVLLPNPIGQLLSSVLSLSSTPPQIRRTPRPAINESLLALDDWPGNLTCGDDVDGVGGYKAYVLSRAPLVVYIEGFLKPEERAHLLEISEPIFEPSTITHNGGAATQRDQTVRDSEVALIPRTEVVRCIEARARAFQGWRGERWVERLRTQRYGPGGHYDHHFDWSSSFGGWGRVTTFMVWADGSADDESNPLVGGGTEFPLLEAGGLDERWCRFVECRVASEDQPAGSQTGEHIAARDAGAGAKAVGASRSASGVVFKPLAGNAVYWENFRPDGTGRGWDETWHAGLPVIQGTKVGLNIWTWGRID